jgi:hypothetical protein
MGKTLVQKALRANIAKIRKKRLSLPHTTTPQNQLPATPPNNTLLICSPPTSRTGPVFELALRRPILLQEAGDTGSAPGDVYSGLAKEVSLAGEAERVSYSIRDIFFGLDARFSQVWNLTDLTIGDLASTMSLAPGEQLTVEVQTSQRKVLDQSTLDSTEAISSSESTTSDKEAVNVARASSKTENWHVDASATVTCGYASATVSGGYAKTVSESNQATINHVTEATKKSAKNLKALHKIDVRGVSETFVQNRMTRALKNPYRDRSLSVNVFQLLKHFSVETDLVEQRGAMIFRVDSISFNNAFVLSHIDFLRKTLLDSSLIDDLPSAIQGAKPTVLSGARDEAIEISKLALRYLFNLPDPANQVQPPLWTPGNILYLDKTDPTAAADQNDPQQSFQTQTPQKAGNTGSGLSVGDVLLGIFTGGASLAVDATAKAVGDFMANEKGIVSSSGFDTAVRTKASALFATLAFFNAVVRETVPNPDGPNPATVSILDAGDNAILLATALANDLQLQWDKLYPDPLKSDELHAMMSSRNFTEVFRRVPGFIAMIRETVRPLVEPASSDTAAISAHNQDIFTLQRLTDHLKDYSAFYTERFLNYIADATSNQAIVDFATKAVTNGNLVFSFNFDPADFDLDRAFLVRREIIVPGLAPLSDADLKRIGTVLTGETDLVSLPVATVEDIETPCDGVHFEVAPGVCILQGVPPPTTSVDLNVQGASLKTSS